MSGREHQLQSQLLHEGRTYHERLSFTLWTHKDYGRLLETLSQLQLYSEIAKSVKGFRLRKVHDLILPLKLARK